MFDSMLISHACVYDSEFHGLNFGSKTMIVSYLQAGQLTQAGGESSSISALASLRRSLISAPVSSPVGGSTSGTNHSAVVIGVVVATCITLGVAVALFCIYRRWKIRKGPGSQKPLLHPSPTASGLEQYSWGYGQFKPPSVPFRDRKSVV